MNPKVGGGEDAAGVYLRRPRPLLVGEVNPHGVDPRMALFPLPKSGAGGRLCRILGLTVTEYIREFDRVNLCLGEWDEEYAEVHAKVLHEELTDTNRVAVLLGNKVMTAFLGRNGQEPFSSYRMNGYTVVVLPHPSGRCRVWNERSSKEKARKAVMKAVRDSDKRRTGK